MFNNKIKNKNKSKANDDHYAQHQSNASTKNIINGIKLSSPHHQSLPSSNQSAQSKIRYFSDTAAYKIKQQQYKQALMFLKQAEKIMEESAKNKIEVHTFYVLCVLQNQVCVYVNLWQLQKAQKYMQTLIQNLQNQIQTSVNKTQYELMTKAMLTVEANQKRKQLLRYTISIYVLEANYYLQYSTILSQLQNHQLSVQYIKKSMQLVKDICQQMMQQELMSSKATNGNGKCYTGCVLEYLVSVREIVDLSIIGEKVKQVIKLLKSVSCDEVGKNQSQKNLKWLREFDYTNITEVFPITLQNLESILYSFEQPTTIAKWQMVMYLSICFFSLATQCRLMAALKYEENRKFTQPFKLSKLFHLQAIQIYAKNIPYQSKYLQNIIESFESHYQTNLIGVREDRKNNNPQNNRTQSQSLLFDNQMLQASIMNEQSHDYLVQSVVKDQKQANNRIFEKIKLLDNKNKGKFPDPKTNIKQDVSHQHKAQNKNKNNIPHINGKKQSGKIIKNQKYGRLHEKAPKSNNSKSQKKITSRRSAEIENSSNRFSIYGLNPHQDLKINLKNKKKSVNQNLKKSSKQKMKRSAEARLSKQISNQKQKITRPKNKNQNSGKVLIKDLNPPTSKKIQEQYMLLHDNRSGQQFKNKEDAKSKHRKGQDQNSREKQKKQKHKQYRSQQKKIVVKRVKSVKSQKKILSKHKL